MHVPRAFARSPYRQSSPRGPATRTALPRATDRSVLIEAAQTAPSREGESRFVRDPAGLTWHVFERQPPSHLADRCDRCLIFDAGTIVRRVCGQRACADWHRLSDAELLALCDGPSR